MARHEGDLSAGKAEPLSLEELLDLLGRGAPVSPQTVEQARACYLSTSEGWAEAVKKLGGAFAGDISALTKGQGE